MDFSPIQDNALKAVDDWFKNGEKNVFHLFGYAGTGKTTLAKHFASGIEGEVLFGAYTGKAAQVMRSKGCEGATTIHSLIYQSSNASKEKLDYLIGEQEKLEVNLTITFEGTLPDDEEEKGKVLKQFFNSNEEWKKLDNAIKKEADKASKPYFTKNDDSPVVDAELVIIDECSMVDNRMGADLVSFGTKILVLGDPAQLPPIGGAGYFTHNVTPNILLEEIHRQAKDNPILEMATLVRQGKPLPVKNYGGGNEVFTKGTKLTDMLYFDQIISGKNATRQATNTKFREEYLKFDDPYPVAGDRIVCLKNNHEQNLFNGAIYKVLDVEGIEDCFIYMTIQSEDTGEQEDVKSLTHYFLGNQDDLKRNYTLKSKADEFDFGYCLTGHKSQGSQWNKVCIYDESYCFRDQRDKWLYTAITRAAQEVQIVKM